MALDLNTILDVQMTISDFITREKSWNLPKLAQVLPNHLVR